MRKNFLILTWAVMALTSIPAAAHQQSIEGTEWGVVGDKGDTARFISFAGSGRVFGFGGCNRFSGTFEQHDEHLKISPLAATRKVCAEDAMAKENDFFGMLAKVRGVNVDHTLLLFLDEAGADLKAMTRRSSEPVGSDSDEP